MTYAKNTDDDPSLTPTPSSSTNARPPSESESNGTKIASTTSTGTSRSASSSPSQAKSTEPQLLPVLQPEILNSLAPGVALAVPSLTGTDLASFALSQGHAKLSTRDLSQIGLELLKQCAKNRDLKAAATVFNGLVSANKSSHASGKKQGPRDRMRNMLERSSQAMSNESPATRAIVDVDNET